MKINFLFNKKYIDIHDLFSDTHNFLLFFHFVFIVIKNKYGSLKTINVPYVSSLAIHKLV